MKKKFAVYAVMTIVVLAALAAMAGIIKLARANTAVQAVTTADLGKDTAMVEAMRGCVMQASSQGLTPAGLDQAHRLCWNRAEIVGAKHKEK